MKRIPTADQRQAAQRLGEAILEFFLSLEPDPPTPPPSASSFRAPVPPAPAPESSLRMLSLNEAAELIGVSGRTLWARSYPRGSIPVVKLGSRVLYQQKALEQWLASQTNQASSK